MKSFNNDEFEKLYEKVTNTIQFKKKIYLEDVSKIDRYLKSFSLSHYRFYLYYVFSEIYGYDLGSGFIYYRTKGRSYTPNFIRIKKKNVVDIKPPENMVIYEKIKGSLKKYEVFKKKYESILLQKEKKSKAYKKMQKEVREEKKNFKRSTVERVTHKKLYSKNEYTDWLMYFVKLLLAARSNKKDRHSFVFSRAINDIAFPKQFVSSKLFNAFLGDCEVFLNKLVSLRKQNGNRFKLFIKNKTNRNKKFVYDNYEPKGSHAQIIELFMLTTFGKYGVYEDTYVYRGLKNGKKHMVKIVQKIKSHYGFRVSNDAIAHFKKFISAIKDIGYRGLEVNMTTYCHLLFHDAKGITGEKKPLMSVEDFLFHANKFYKSKDRYMYSTFKLGTDDPTMILHIQKYEDFKAKMDIDFKTGFITKKKYDNKLKEKGLPIAKIVNKINKLKKKISIVGIGSDVSLYSNKEVNYKMRNVKAVTVLLIYTIMLMAYMMFSGLLSSVVYLLFGQINLRFIGLNMTINDVLMYDYKGYRLLYLYYFIKLKIYVFFFIIYVKAIYNILLDFTNLWLSIRVVLWTIWNRKIKNYGLNFKENIMIDDKIMKKYIGIKIKNLCNVTIDSNVNDNEREMYDFVYKSLRNENLDDYSDIVMDKQYVDFKKNKDNRYTTKMAYLIDKTIRRFLATNKMKKAKIGIIGFEGVQVSDSVIRINKSLNKKHSVDLLLMDMTMLAHLNKIEEWKLNNGVDTHIFVPMGNYMTQNCSKNISLDCVVFRTVSKNLIAKCNRFKCGYLCDNNVYNNADVFVFKFAHRDIFIKIKDMHKYIITTNYKKNIVNDTHSTWFNEVNVLKKRINNLKEYFYFGKKDINDTSITCVWSDVVGFKRLFFFENMLFVEYVDVNNVKKKVKYEVFYEYLLKLKNYTRLMRSGIVENDKIYNYSVLNSLIRYGRKDVDKEGLNYILVDNIYNVYNSAGVLMYKVKKKDMETFKMNIDKYVNLTPEGNVFLVGREYASMIKFSRCLNTVKDMFKTSNVAALLTMTNLMYKMKYSGIKNSERLCEYIKNSLIRGFQKRDFADFMPVLKPSHMDKMVELFEYMKKKNFGRKILIFDDIKTLYLTFGDESLILVLNALMVYISKYVPLKSRLYEFNTLLTKIQNVNSIKARKCDYVDHFKHITTLKWITYVDNSKTFRVNAETDCCYVNLVSYGSKKSKLCKMPRILVEKLSNGIDLVNKFNIDKFSASSYETAELIGKYDIKKQVHKDIIKNFTYKSMRELVSSLREDSEGTYNTYNRNKSIGFLNVETYLLSYVTDFILSWVIGDYQRFKDELRMNYYVNNCENSYICFDEDLDNRDRSNIFKKKNTYKKLENGLIGKLLNENDINNSPVRYFNDSYCFSTYDYKDKYEKRKNVYYDGKDVYLILNDDNLVKFVSNLEFIQKTSGMDLELLKGRMVPMCNNIMKMIKKGLCVFDNYSVLGGKGSKNKFVLFLREKIDILILYNKNMGTNTLDEAMEYYDEKRLNIKKIILSNGTKQLVEKQNVTKERVDLLSRYYNEVAKDELKTINTKIKNNIEVFNHKSKDIDLDDKIKFKKFKTNKKINKKKNNNQEENVVLDDIDE